MIDRTRAPLSLGALLAATALCTAALSIAAIEVVAQMRAGAGHEFNLQIAARERADGTGPGGGDSPWVPTAADWVEGNPVPLAVGGEGTGAGARHYSIAVRNASAELPSALCIAVLPLEPGAAFDDLRFTLTGGDGLGFAADGRDAPCACARLPLAPGEVRLLELRIEGGGAPPDPQTVRLSVDGESR